MSADILIFAEDPGAANYLSPLQLLLAEKKLSVHFLADGIAKEYFDRSSIKYSEINGMTAVEVLHKVQPSLVLVGTAENPKTFSHELVTAAKKLKIKSAAVIDAMMNARNRFRGETTNELQYAPDFLFVPDEHTQREFVSLGVPSERIFISGHPHFDFVRLKKAGLLADQALLRKKLFPEAHDKKVILFASEGAACLQKNGEAKDRRTETALEIFLESKRDLPQIYSVLRLHPKDKEEYFSAYFPQLDQISSGGSPLEVLAASDIVIGLTSMLMTEAALLGKPTLSIVSCRAEQDWLPALRNGATMAASDAHEFRQKLHDIVGNPERFQPGKEFVIADSSGATIATIMKILGRIRA
jgi:hypothetical protein